MFSLREWVAKVAVNFMLTLSGLYSQRLCGDLLVSEVTIYCLITVLHFMCFVFLQILTFISHFGNIFVSLD